MASGFQMTRSASDPTWMTPWIKYNEYRLITDLSESDACIDLANKLILYALFFCMEKTNLIHFQSHNLFNRFYINTDNK